MMRLKVSQHGAEVQTLELIEGREYLIGRNSECDVRLQTHSGISRVHVRVRHDGQSWVAEIVSKFGKIIRDGSPVPAVELEHGVSFQVPPYDFVFEDEATPAIASGDGFSRAGLSMSRSAAASRPNTLATNSPFGLASADFNGNNEATAVGAIRLAAFLRILPGQGRPEQEICLEGGPWLAGRDEDASIFINDPKASRKQFEILQTSKGWLIKDLGSSNGTSLNGAVLPANEALPLKSGDVISVQSVQIMFEARDVAFAQKAAALPAMAPLSESHAMAATPSQQYPAPADYGMQYPANNGSGGAIVYRGENPPPPNKKNGMVLKIAIAIMALGVAYYFSSGGSPKEETAKPVLDSELAKLSPAERQHIENIYRLAQEFYIRKDYNMAIGQLETIHKLLPKGYEKSLELKESCEIALRAIEEQEAIRRQREELRRQDEEVKELIAKCRPIAAASSDPAEIRVCLDRAVQLRPDNADVQKMISDVDQRKLEADMRRAQGKAYAASAARGRELYSKAVRLLKNGRRREAIGAFETHIHSKFADPDGLKAKSEGEVARIRASLASEALSNAEQAERALERSDFKGALEFSKRSLDIDPANQRAHDAGAKARSQLNSILEALYADSVVYENFGQLEAAKEKWRKILEADRKGGEFYVKARNKLNTYGGP